MNHTMHLYRAPQFSQQEQMLLGFSDGVGGFHSPASCFETWPECSIVLILKSYEM